MAQDEETYIKTGEHPLDNTRIMVGSNGDVEEFPNLYAMLGRDRPPPSEENVKEYKKEAKEHYRILNSESMKYILGDNPDGFWDRIYIPKEKISRRDIEYGLIFGLRQKFGITSSLRFRWDRTRFFVTPSSPGGYDLDMKIPDWVING